MPSALRAGRRISATARHSGPASATASTMPASKARGTSRGDVAMMAVCLSGILSSRQRRASPSARSGRGEACSATSHSIWTGAGACRRAMSCWIASREQTDAIASANPCAMSARSASSSDGAASIEPLGVSRSTTTSATLNVDARGEASLWEAAWCMGIPSRARRQWFACALCLKRKL